MTKQSRPRGSSRTPASRPRRVAGRAGVPAEVGVAGEDVTEERADAPDATDAPDASDEPEPIPEPEPSPEAESDTEPPAGPSMFAGARVTTVLLSVVVLLTVATLAMAGYLWLGEEESAAAARVPEGEIAVPADRPIQLPWSEAQSAAAQAAEAATTALETSWQDYDEQLDEAVALMTPGFAEKFRTTATDARAGVLESKVEIAVRVVAQSVVRANASQVQAMLFLDQYTTKQGEQEGTTVSPYRVLVTLVHTDGGWLISDLQTR